MTSRAYNVENYRLVCPFLLCYNIILNAEKLIMKPHTQMITEIRHLQLRVAGLKMDFENFITDKSIDLEERWSVFMQAPSYLKENERFIVHWEAIPEDLICYEGELMHCERYERVEIADINERIEEYREEHGKDPFDVTKFREEVLEMNLHSYIFDW